MVSPLRQTEIRTELEMEFPDLPVSFVNLTEDQVHPSGRHPRCQITIWLEGEKKTEELIIKIDGHADRSFMLSV